jgi:hypothetical protein
MDGTHQKQHIELVIRLSGPFGRFADNQHECGIGYRSGHVVVPKMDF